MEEEWSTCPFCSASIGSPNISTEVSDSVVMGDVVVIDNDSEAISQGFKKAMIEVEADKKKKEKEELDRQRLTRKIREKEQKIADKERKINEKKRLEKQKIADKERKINDLKKNDIMITKYNSQKIQSLRERLNSKPFGDVQRHLVRELRKVYLNHYNWCQNRLLQGLKTNLPNDTQSNYPSLQSIEYFYTVRGLGKANSDKIKSLKYVWRDVGWVPLKNNVTSLGDLYRKRTKEGTDWKRSGWLDRSFTADVLPIENQVDLKLLIDEAKALSETHSVSKRSLTTNLLLLLLVAFFVFVYFLDLAVQGNI
ncbi:hypothetical protein N9L27_04025 [Candidatus Poseidoniales archaeon]|nr:hypothetical protein [Candidatus Poseidoniales archaeon]